MKETFHLSGSNAFVAGIMVFSFLSPLAGSPRLETPSWQIDETGIFRHFGQNEVIVGPGGDVFFFETGQSTIRHYAEDGVFLGTICRAGSGPGEVRGILQVWLGFSDGKLYVMDGNLRSFQVFETDGRFVEVLKFPGGKPMFPSPTKYGWYHLSLPSEDSAAKDRSLVLCDADFQKKISVNKWPLPDFMGRRSGDKVKIDVAVDAAKVTASADGSLVFLYIPGKAEIKVIDAETGVEKKVIRLEIHPLPIDGSWADRKLEEEAKRDSPVKFEYTVGEHFPLVKSLKLDPLGNLLVWTSIHYVKEDLPPLVFNQAGQPAETAFSVTALGRIVGTHGDMAYVTTFDPQKEEAGLAKLKLTDVNAFVKDWP